MTDSPRLWPIALCFAWLGLFWGSWAVATLDIERFVGVGIAGFGAVISVALVGGAGANLIAGPLVERWGTGPALARAMALSGVLILVLAVITSRVAFVAVFAVAVAATGLTDVAMNVGATAALGSRPGHLARFHALFNVGVIAGALTTAPLIAAGLSWRWAWGLDASIALALAVIAARVPLPAGAAGERFNPLGGLLILWREGLIGLALVFAASALAEGGIDTWGVLFLRSQLALSVLVGSGAYVIGHSLATMARAVIGPGAGGLGASRGAALGGAVASLGLALEATSTTPILSAAGLAVAVIGVSLCWPLLLAVSSRASERPGLVVGGLSTAGYLGLLVGPSIVGALSAGLGLRTGLWALATFALMPAAGMRWTGRSRASQFP